jgi:AraC family transcriptional regulator
MEVRKSEVRCRARNILRLEAAGIHRTLVLCRVQLLATHLVEKFTDAAAERPDYRGGLPIGKLRKVEDHVREQLAQDVSVEMLAALVELSPFHFSRVFKQATGMTRLQFVTCERVTRAQQFIRETSCRLIEIALEVGYSSRAISRRSFGAWSV